MAENMDRMALLEEQLATCRAEAEAAEISAETAAQVCTFRQLHRLLMLTTLHAS